MHRDLKPANVKISPDGRVKVLDFGLAKMQAAAEHASAPMETVMHTEAGMVLGTVPYMSPEQARGSAVDRRADIWAFGCILYELLTGRQAFPGDTASDILASVLAREPDWTALPAHTPPQLRALVERCLRKEPRHRLRDIGDALDELRDGRKRDDVVIPARGREYAWRAVALVAIAAAAVAAIAAWRKPASDTGAVAFTVEAPLRGPLTVGEPLSPDGTKLAFVAASGGGAPMIWVRPLESTEPRALEGTEGATDLFWSPDGLHLAFVADGRLKRIPVAGGAVQVICALQDAAGTQGGSWSRSGVILLGTRGALLRVPAAGGEAVTATRLDASAEDQWHTAPSFLPDGRNFVFNVVGRGFAGLQAYVGSLDSTDRQPLTGIRSPARYSDTGHLLFRRGEALMAQRFDASSVTLSGEPFVVAPRAAGGNRAPFSAANGALAYLASPDTQTEVRWFDRTGASLGVAGSRGIYFNPELAPDDGRLAIDRDSQGNIDVWLIDPVRGVTERITTNEAADYTPIWSGDATAVIFTSYRGGTGRIYRRNLVAGGDETLLLETAKEQRASDWSSDGRYVVYVQEEPAANDQPAREDIWAVALDDLETRIRITDTVADDVNPRLSPDVRWIAYESSESGRPEVYLQSFPRPGARRQVSAGGGLTPRWAPDGSEIFYLTAEGTVMSVSVASEGDNVRLGAPTRLFRADVAFTGVGRVLDVSADGQRFLLNVVPADRLPPSIVVLNDWAARLGQ